MSRSSSFLCEWGKVIVMRLKFGTPALKIKHKSLMRLKIGAPTLKIKLNPRMRLKFRTPAQKIKLNVHKMQNEWSFSCTFIQ